MKRSTAILLSAIILMMTISSAFLISEKWTAHTPFAQDGLLDLSSWHFKENRTIKLNGEWAFYPNELISPELSKDTFIRLESDKKLIDVPGSWKDYLSKEQSEIGSGTYRLKIKVPEDKIYGIKTNAIRYANRLYINGELVGSSGVPSINIADFKADSKMYVAQGKSVNKEVEIVLHVSNYASSMGGLVHALDFGLIDDIILLKDRNRALDAFLIAGYLIIGLFFLGSFYQRKKDVSEVYFSVFCLLQGVYISTLNERLFSLVFPAIETSILTKIQMILIHLSVLFFLWFIYTYFKEYTRTKLIYFLTGLLLLQTVVFGVPNLSQWLFSGLAMNIGRLVIVSGLGLAYLYIIIILIRAFIKKTAGAEYLLIIMTTFLSYGLLLALDFLFEIQIGHMPVILFLVMTLGLALLIGYRQNVAFEKAEQLSKELLVHDRLKDEFLAKTSHELQTPLHGILNLSQSLIEGAAGPLQLKQHESMLLIQSVGRRLSHIVDDLLHASIMKKEELLIQRTAVDLNVLKDIIAEMNLLISSPQKLRIVSKIADDLPAVYVDEYRLQQIMFNLINNAITFTKSGEIIISAEVYNDEMSISVADTGIGIEKDELEQIFMSFYQIESTLRGENRGLGLGLTIAKQLVGLLGGEMSVLSEVGRGTTFTFTLPLATEKQLKEGNTEVAATTLDSMKIEDEQILNLELPAVIPGELKYKILVVDDDHVNLKVLLDLVSSLNYTVIAVDNGHEALEIINEQSIDLLVLDLMMPNMSGYEVSESVRERFHMVELPILILTAAGQSADRIASFEAGANDFLRKPVTAANLKTSISSLLAMKETAKQSLEKELSYFHGQITPHFLYNTLNTIISLSYKDEEKTREALQHLTTYFRAKLDVFNYDTLVSLSKELELIDAYLSIEKIRYGDRLIIEYDIDESIKTHLPSMTIQPLIENAIQHGIAKKSEGGVLKLSVSRTIMGIEISIQDNGIGISKEKQVALLDVKTAGIGFSNTFKKLKLIKNSQFSLESAVGVGTKITITLPEVTYDENSSS